MAVFYGNNGDDTLLGTGGADEMYGWAEGGGPATDRGRNLTSALRAYARLVTSGATGAVRSL